MANTISEFLKCIEEDKKLTELIKGKRVCLCGPSITNIGSGYGEYIDSFDTVCRINWHLTGKDGWDPNLNCDFGEKTDIMFSGFFLKYHYDNIKKMREPGTKFNIFKNLKYLYLVDPVNMDIYQNFDNGKYFKIHSNNMFCKIEKMEEYIKKLDLNFGIINCWLGRIENINYLYKIKNKKETSFTSSGVHAIQTILRHEPKELFITGMNFGNFGKGDQLKNLYVDKGNSRNHFGTVSKNKIKNKKWTIHTNKNTLFFLKKIFDEYDNIELDKILKNFFN